MTEFRHETLPACLQDAHASCPRMTVVVTRATEPGTDFTATVTRCDCPCHDCRHAPNHPIAARDHVHPPRRCHYCARPIRHVNGVGWVSREE